MKIKHIVFAVFATAMSFCAFAQNGQRAEHGTVVAVSISAPAPGQDGYEYAHRAYHNNGSGYNRYTRSVAGAAVGGLVGAVLGRNTSNSKRYAITAATAAIGGAIGNTADRRAQRRQTEQDIASARNASVAQQIVVRLDNGRTVGVRAFGLHRFCEGEKVWLVGTDQLIPANR